MPRPPVSTGFIRVPVAFNLNAISIEEGLRAGLSVAVLVAASYLLHAPILLEAGLGALLTCLCDAGGQLRRRVPALLSFAAIGSAMIVLFGLLRPIGPLLIPLACLGIFGFSFARIYNQTALQVGNLLSVVLVLALDRSFHALHPALIFGEAFMAGSLWALLLTLVIWRVHPNRPSRQAVSQVYAALAALGADAHALLTRHEPAADAQWERHASLHRSRVRELIEQARTIVAARLHTSGAATRATVGALLQLDSAEQTFRTLIGLTDLLESGADQATTQDAAALLDRLAAVLRSFSQHIVQDTDEGLATIGASIASLASTVRGFPPDCVIRRIGDTSVDRLRATLNLSGATEAIAPGGTDDLAWTERLLAPIRANLTWGSAALRHAARAALVSAAGFAITFVWPTSYGHWLTITMVLTLQPYYALTLQRALERIGGTVLGGLLAAGISLVCRTPVLIALAIFPLSVLALSLRAVNFGLYITALTPVIVLLVELGSHSHGHLTIVLMRALYTVIGGSLAVLGCVLLWPSWEPGRLDQELRAAVRNHSRYAALVLGLLGGEVPLAEVDAARRAAGLASNNLEASLSRAMLEPRRGGRDRLEPVAVVGAALRRMAGRLSALQLNPPTQGNTTLHRWGAWVAEVARVLDQPGPPPLPDPPEVLPEDPTLHDGMIRIARQLELSAGALRRYAAA